VKAKLKKEIELYNNIISIIPLEFIKGFAMANQAGNLRVRGSNPGSSRQPLTPGCQKITSDSQPINSVPLTNKNLQGAFKKKIFLKNLSDFKNQVHIEKFHYSFP